MASAPPVVLTRRADFLAANRGLRVARPGFVLLVLPNAAQRMRFGITVTRKIGNAVVRNRMKRRFRALLREALPHAGLPYHDHVLIGRADGVERDFAALRAELNSALARAAAGKGDPPRKGRGGNRPRGKGGAAPPSPRPDGLPKGSTSGSARGSPNGAPSGSHGKERSCATS